MYKFISHDEKETKKIGKFLASQLNKGDIVVLSGDLGSGKTKLTEGFLSFWNLEDEISSPTFTIVNEYNNSKVNIYHFDLYRLENEEEFFEIGGNEYFSNGISIIEWGELIEHILPSDHIKVNFSRDTDNENIRYLQFEMLGDKSKQIIEGIKNENFKYIDI